MRPEAALSPDFLVSLRERSVRDEHGLYLAEGFRFLSAALETKAQIVGLMACRRMPHGVIARDLAAQRGIPCVDVAPSCFQSVSLSKDPQGVLVVLRQPWRPLPASVSSRDLWLGIERVRNPGNLGTLLRSAAAVGAKGLMVFGPPRDRADPFDPQCVRAAMGAHFRLQIVGTSHRAFRAWEHRYQLMVFGADGTASRDYRTARLSRPSLIMLGHEREGLSEAQCLTCDDRLRIPMASGLDSLNVAMAGTVLLYEAWAQRHPLRKRR